MNLKEILPYYKETKILEGFYIVTATYPGNWTAYNSSDEVIKVERDNNSVGNAYIYGAKINDIDDINEIYELIKLTIEVNIDAEKKMELLKNSIERLKIFFTEHTLDELSKLDFIISDDVVNNEIVLPTIPEIKGKKVSGVKKATAKEVKLEKAKVTPVKQQATAPKTKALPKQQPQPQMQQPMQGNVIEDNSVILQGDDGIDQLSKEYGF